MSGEVKVCPFCEMAYHHGHRQGCYFRQRGVSEKQRLASWQVRPGEDALAAERDALVDRRQADLVRLAEAWTENEKLREAQRWVPVEERLPDDEIEVLATDGRDMMVAFRSGGWYFVNAQEGVYLNVTHWMDLPAGPVEAEE